MSVHAGLAKAVSKICTFGTDDLSGGAEVRLHLFNININKVRRKTQDNLAVQHVFTGVATRTVTDVKFS